MAVTINVDASEVISRFGVFGIPEQVRKNLRMTIPSVMRNLSAEIDSNLSALKSRKRVQIKGGPQGQMIENARQVVGRAEMIWTGDPSASMVPQVLESGARPHVIAARNANSLAFMWPAVGGMAFFKKVNHPGFPGIRYMQNAFNSMRSEITSEIERAVMDGTK